MGKIAPKPADFLSRDELRGFTARSDMAGFGLIVANWSLIAAAFALVALWTNPMTIVAAGHVEVIRRAVPELDVGRISAAWTRPAWKGPGDPPDERGDQSRRSGPFRRSRRGPYTRGVC